MIQTSEGNLPQGLDTAIHTGLERGRRISVLMSLDL